MIPQSPEVREHAWWKSGADFRWTRPRLTIYRPADSRPRLFLNRYPHNVIGMAVVAFGRCWGVTWKGSRTRPGKPDSKGCSRPGADRG